MSASPFTRPGSPLKDLAAAWPDRLADAEALLAAGRHGWAIATGLYALEIRLKEMICRRLDLDALPKGFETHDLDSLLLLAGLSRRIKRRAARAVKENWDGIARLAGNLNDYRYKPSDRWSATQAVTFFRQLRDPPDGVLPWLRRTR